MATLLQAERFISLSQHPAESTSYRRNLSVDHKDGRALQIPCLRQWVPNSIPYRLEPWVQSKGPPNRQHSFVVLGFAMSGWGASYRGSAHAFRDHRASPTSTA